MRLKLTADRVLIRGPKIDGSYVVSFEVGEYEVKKVAQLMSEVNNEAVVQLTIEQNEN
jgi:hypothetical protein